MGFGDLGLRNLMCIAPRFEEGSKLSILEKVDDDEYEYVNGGLKDLPKRRKNKSKCKGKSANEKLKNNDHTVASTDVEKDSDRLTVRRLVSILRDAYVVTMMSFATKPGGLGGMVMGGNIDLPDATPRRTFKEPRNFVRSWSMRTTRPNVGQDFTQRGQPWKE